MKRLLSRRMAVALLVLTTSVLGGLSVAVVAFGQDPSSTDPDATVPLGDYTGTTPATGTSTAPVSSYTTPATTPSTNTVESVPPTSTTEGTTTGGTKPARAHGKKAVTVHGSGSLPSQATGRAPTKLAFTGGEPILIGGFGAALMLTGVALHERRRRRAAGEL
jgi:hypothetical protein